MHPPRLLYICVLRIYFKCFYTTKHTRTKIFLNFEFLNFFLNQQKTNKNNKQTNKKSIPEQSYKPEVFFYPVFFYIYIFLFCIEVFFLKLIIRFSIRECISACFSLLHTHTCCANLYDVKEVYLTFTFRLENNFLHATNPTRKKERMEMFYLTTHLTHF